MLLTPEELKITIDALNVKQQKFSELHINRHLSGAEAYRRAGYTAANPYVGASQLLNNPNVQAYVSHLKAVQVVEAEVTAAQVVNELKPVAFQDIKDFISVDALTGDVMVKDLQDVDTRAIKKIAIKRGKPGEADIITLELHDKLKAAELLGKHTAAFTENLNLTNNGKDLPETKVENKIFINHRRKGESLESD